MSGEGGISVGLLLGTGPVVQAVIVILVAFSVGSWGIIIHKLVQTSRARRESDRFTTIFWESKNLAAINIPRSRRCSVLDTRSCSSSLAPSARWSAARIA
jgi:hypothetical protein